jgi:hypothetical protein
VNAPSKLLQLVDEWVVQFSLAFHFGEFGQHWILIMVTLETKDDGLRIAVHIGYNLVVQLCGDQLGAVTQVF